MGESVFLTKRKSKKQRLCLTNGVKTQCLMLELCLKAAVRLTTIKLTELKVFCKPVHQS